MKDFKNKRYSKQPYYANNAEITYILATASTFIVGAMLGSVLTLAVML